MLDELGVLLCLALLPPCLEGGAGTQDFTRGWETTTALHLDFSVCLFVCLFVFETGPSMALTYRVNSLYRPGQPTTLDSSASAS